MRTLIAVSGETERLVRTLLPSSVRIYSRSGVQTPDEGTPVNPLSTLPTTAEQARRALLLLGAPAPARLVAAVHGALFDGDLDVPALAELVRRRAPGFGPALSEDLTAARGLVALTDWPLDRRLVTPVRHRADMLLMVVRVARYVAARPYAGGAAHRLLRSLAETVPYGPEAADLGDAARAAHERLGPALAAEEPARTVALRRAATLDETQRRYGVPAVPAQRGRG
jgi:hypothetical protein